MRSTRPSGWLAFVLHALAAATLCSSLASQPWNKWHLGPVGVMGELQKGTNLFRVLVITKGCPGALAGLRVGDLIHGVNGREFEATTFRHQDGGKGPLEALGWAIDEVEGTDGLLKLRVRRPATDKPGTGKQKRRSKAKGQAGALVITVKLRVIGSFSPTFPYKCRKSTMFIDQCLDNILQQGINCRTSTRSLIGLALLSRGSQKYQPQIKQIRDTLVSRSGYLSKTWNWPIGYAGIFLAEYYLVHQDPEVLEALKVMVKVTEPRVMGTGSFGYGLLDKRQRARPCNSAGSTVLWFWALAKKCGVQIDEVHWNLAVAYLALSTRGDGGIRYNFSAGGYDNASKTANTCIAFNIIGRQGLAEVGNALKADQQRHVINPAYTWKQAQWDRVIRELTSRDLTGAHSNYLIRHLKSARENHVTMSLGMLALPSALSIHRDRTRFREFMDYWKWFLRLSMGPNGEVYYHGNNQGHMGDRQLGQKRMAPVTYALMLSVGQEKLNIHGGYPAVDGVVYSELDAKMQTIYVEIKKQNYKSALGTLTSLAAGSPSLTTTQARSMLDFVMEIVQRELEKAEEAFDALDYVLAKDLVTTSRKRFGSLKIYKQFDAKLQVEWSKPEHKKLLRRGREYYRLIKLLETNPKSFHHRMKRFIGSNVNGYYSRMPAVMEIREQVLGADG